MRVFRHVPLAIIFFLMLSVQLFAAPPDAGQILREQQPQRQIPQTMPQQRETPERPAMVDKGIKVKVKYIYFTGLGNMATKEELSPLVSDAAGRNSALMNFRRWQIR